MEQNAEIAARFLNEPEFQEIVGRGLMQQVYDEIRARYRQEDPPRAA